MNTTVQIYETFRKDNFFASSGGNFLWLPLLFVQENYWILCAKNFFNIWSNNNFLGDSEVKTDYPGWGIALIIFLIFLSISWIPIVAFLRWKGKSITLILTLTGINVEAALSLRILYLEDTWSYQDALYVML